MASPELVDYIVATGSLMGAAAWLPRMIAAITRKKSVLDTGEINRFEVIMKAQDARLDDCEQECQACQTELKAERNSRIQEREHFFRQIAHINSRVYECEGIMRRMGWKEERKKKRTGTDDGHP